MNIDILKKTAEALENGKKAALATVTYSSGSTPGTTGAIMAVFDDGQTVGTIGGGSVEHDVIDRTMAAFKCGESFEFDYDLSKGGNLGMVCGGRLKGFVNLFNPNQKLVLFGAGHVSQKIAKLAAQLPFDIYVVDDRGDFADEFPGIKKYLTCSAADATLQIGCDENTFIVIATRGHRHDYEALRSVVDKPAAYIGMMGSKTKVAEIKAQLLTDGVPQAQIDRIYAPIGLDIGNGTPSEIALSILGEILAVKNSGQCVHLKHL